MSFIFDSNVYDYIHDQSISADEIRSVGEVYITNVQLSEISNTPNILRREALLSIIEATMPKKLLLLSGVWVDELKWDDDQVWIDEISPECSSLLGNAERNIPWMDALLGEVALRHGLTLVTLDAKFTARANKVGIFCVTPEEVFCEILKTRQSS